MYYKIYKTVFRFVPQRDPGPPERTRAPILPTAGQIPRLNESMNGPPSSWTPCQELWWSLAVTAGGVSPVISGSPAPCKDTAHIGTSWIPFG